MGGWIDGWMGGRVDGWKSSACKRDTVELIELLTFDFLPITSSHWKDKQLLHCLGNESHS